MKRYRKKPIEIEAIKFEYTVDGLEELLKFVDTQPVSYWKERHPDALGKATIATLEGVMVAKEGDYIIKGVNGEFYPCKADIFEKTYEEVTADDDFANALTNLYKSLLPPKE